MILQTGQRTDIPAFYSKWFYNRIKEGFVLARNPYNPLQVTRYEINPDVVDLISFCTKNPGPMFDDFALLKDYGMFWYVTITGFAKDMEPNVPDKEKLVDDFKRLSDMVGKTCVGWRYDPIIINDKYTVDYHLTAFKKLASSLRGYTDICVISFVDLYTKVRLNAPEIARVVKDNQIYLGKEMIAIARDNGMTVRPCGEGDFLAEFGADCSGCMTKDIYERAIGKKMNIPKFKPLRKECACYLGTDIGAYNSCLHLCRYCYANYDADSVRKNHAGHDENSPFLIGGHIDGEQIHRAKQTSWVDGQMTFDMLNFI